MTSTLVTVMFGDRQSVLLNANCTAVNLLEVLKRKLGMQHDNIVLDLADDRGNVQRLHCNPQEQASKFLVSRSCYIAVLKQADVFTANAAGPEANANASSASDCDSFAPLLANYLELFPDYKLHTYNLRREAHARHNHKETESRLDAPKTRR